MNDDLISRSWLLEQLEDLGDTRLVKRNFIALATNAPTVDAEPVVRCRDCVGKSSWYKDVNGCDICGMSGLYIVENNDFCSYGERKENG